MSIFLELPSFVYSMAVKFSLAFVLFSGTLLLIPDEYAIAVKLVEFRQENITIIWLFFILAAAVLVSNILKCIYNLLCSLIINFLAKKKRNRLITQRLKSLSESEKYWVTHCLYYRAQTLNAPATASTPNALVSKDLIYQGSGHVMNVPYTIYDDVWQHLIGNRNIYIPEGISESEKNNFEKKLYDFKKSLHP